MVEQLTHLWHLSQRYSQPESRCTQRILPCHKKFIYNNLIEYYRKTYLRCEMKRTAASLILHNNRCYRQFFSHWCWIRFFLTLPFMGQPTLIRYCRASSRPCFAAQCSCKPMRKHPKKDNITTRIGHLQGSYEAQSMPFGKRSLYAILSATVLISKCQHSYVSYES